MRARSVQVVTRWREDKHRQVDSDSRYLIGLTPMVQFIPGGGLGERESGTSGYACGRADEWRAERNDSATGATGSSRMPTEQLRTDW